MTATAYLGSVVRLLDQVRRSQLDKIEEAGDVVAATVRNGGIIHVFGSGHSHIIAEEGLYRAGGLAAVNAILESGLMLHEGAVVSTRRERLAGYGAIVANHADLRPGDVMIVASNSGINPAPVEVALVAKGLGLMVIAITSLTYSQQLKTERDDVDDSLADVADITIDNAGMYGDAAIELADGLRAGPTSTVVACAIFNAIVVQAVHRLWEAGIEPPLYRSSTSSGAEQHNATLVARYRERVRHL